MKNLRNRLTVVLTLIALFTPSGASYAANDTSGATDSNHLDTYGVTLDWNPESFWAPSGCSTFDFSFRNGSGIRLLTVGYEILSQFGDKISWSTEVGVDPGISGTWSDQICASNLSDGLGPYRVRLLIEDYSSQSRSVEGSLTFKARPAIIKNLRAAPTNKQAKITWTYLPSAEGYEIRISGANSSTRFGAWYQLNSKYSTSFIWTGLKSKATYRVQVRAVTAFGYGDVVSLSFKAK